MPDSPRLPRCLAISGSLRAVSSNRTVLRAAARLAAINIAVSLYEGLAETLRTMGARLVPEHPIILPLTVRQMSEDAIVADPRLSQLLADDLATLARAASERA